MPRPWSVTLDITERCNLRCVMCYFARVDRLRFPPFDREIGPRGNMPLEVFERIAADLFPRAWRVGLACAAEPLIHPDFAGFVRIAGRYGVRDLWLPTNLLALDESRAEAIVEAGVRTVAVSIDGFTPESYERIRVGGTWSRLLSRLELLNRVRRGSRTQLRIIFTWMRSNFAQLRRMPAFAAEHGASELDVRFVGTVSGLDLGSELLGGEDPALLRRELAHTAHDAVRRGLRLSSFPDFETAANRRGLRKRMTRRAWRVKAGLDRPEYWALYWRKRLNGCAFPRRSLVIRPNGAVLPCMLWDADPIAYYPERDLVAMGRAMERIRDGLRRDRPLGTCNHCTLRRDSYYEMLGQLSADTA